MFSVMNYFMRAAAIWWKLN